MNKLQKTSKKEISTKEINFKNLVPDTSLQGNSLKGLNREQYFAVTFDVNKHLLVLAGAGSGKTKVLVSRYSYLMNTLNLSSENIMAITFTKKAAEEMKTRIRNITGKKLTYNNSWVANFHHICNKILRKNFEKANFKNANFCLIDNEDQKDILKKEICNNSDILSSQIVKFLQICNETNNEKNLRIKNNINYDLNENLDLEFGINIDENIKKIFQIKNLLSLINYFKERGIRANDFLNLANNYLIYKNNYSPYDKNKDKEFLIEYSNLISDFHKNANNIHGENLKVDLFFNAGNFLPINVRNINEQQKCFQIFYEIYKAYENYCFQKDIVDFSESLIRCYELLYTHKDILKIYQNQFKYILIDEFQDTNQLQYRWLTLLYGKNNYLFAVGDDDQSIYKFRGAEIINVKLFNYNFAKNNIIQLEQNYRSTKNILNAANNVIKNNFQRIMDKNLWTKSENGNKINELVFNDANSEARFIVSKIFQRVKEYNTNKFSDFTILYRNNSFSQNLEKHLLKNNIPYLIIGGFKFYERQEIKDALAYIQLCLNPDNDLAFDRVVNVPKRKNGKTLIENIKILSRNNLQSYFKTCQKIINSNYSYKGIKEFISIIEDLQKKSQELENSNLPNKLQELYFYLLQRTKLLTYYAKNEIFENLLKGRTLSNESIIEIIEKVKENGEQDEFNKAENLLELASALNSFEKEDENLDKPLSQLLQDFINYVLFEAIDDDKTIEDKVTLMTVHKAKGLEFPIVYLIGMEEKNFPSFFATTINDLEEERRLMYVAITRAKKELNLSWVTSERNQFLNFKRKVTKSRFLNEIPNELKKINNFNFVPGSYLN